MRKILIFYGAYGGGHLSASKSIKEYIDNHYEDTETSIVDCIEYISHGFNKITTAAYRGMTKNAPWTWKKVYYKSKKGTVSTISHTSNIMMALKLKKFIRKENPDLIICTHPFASQMCAFLKKKRKIKATLATVMTDYVSHPQWLTDSEYMDYYFVAHEGMRNQLISMGISAFKVFATGIPLSNRFLQSYNKPETLSYFGLLPGKKTVLFFAGGEFGLSNSRTYKMLESMAKNFDNIQIIAISGKNKKMHKNFEEIVKEHNKEDSIKVLSFTDKVPELMSISDMVITKPGGLTTTESLASGLPIIVINPIPGQEEENAEFLEKNNLAIWIRKNDDAEEVLKSIFNNPSLMRKMKINARLFAKKNSTKDICKILLDK